MWKKDENVTHDQEKKLSIETSSGQILELMGNKLNAAIITLFKYLAIIIGEPQQKNGNLLKRDKF